MAASELTVADISRSGLLPALVAANVDGNFFDNTGREFINIANGDASPHTVTIDSQVNCDQTFDHDDAIAVPASESRLIGPFPKGRYNDANDQVQLTYDAVTSVTIQIIRLPLS